MILDHDLEGQNSELVESLLPDLDPEQVLRALARSSYTDNAELTAEALADQLATRIINSDAGNFLLHVRLLLLEITPIWNRVAFTHHDLILEKRRASALIVLSRHAETQLHRRLVEIRDCEMAGSATNGRLDAHDRSVVERAELALERRSGSRLTR